MQKPYLLSFEKPAIKITQELPSWSRYSFASVQEHILRVFDGAELSSQRLHEPPFHIELFEIQASRSFRINYEVFGEKYFLLLMPEGQATFTTPEGFYISYAKSKHSAFIFSDQARYISRHAPGYNSLWCITFDPDWLLFFSKDQPVLHSFMINKSLRGFDLLPYCRIDGGIARWLKNLYSVQVRGKGSLDGHLRYYISMILERYIQIALIRQQSLPWHVKYYLDENFSASNINYSHLSGLFNESERTLRYHFQKEFGISIHQYLTHKRLKLAHQLIQCEGQLICDVYLQTGYQDESTFRRAYRNFFLSQGKSDV